MFSHNLLVLRFKMFDTFELLWKQHHNIFMMRFSSLSIKKKLKFNTELPFQLIFISEWQILYEKDMKRNQTRIFDGGILTIFFTSLGGVITRLFLDRRRATRRKVATNCEPRSPKRSRPVGCPGAPYSDQLLP